MPKRGVALAHALVRKPKVLLLDEPLSAPDSEMQSKMQARTLSLHKKYNLTTVLNSHDLTKITKMSDRVLCLKDGNIHKDEKPQDVMPFETLKEFY